jgi:hypothetical protein
VTTEGGPLEGGHRTSCQGNKSRSSNPSMARDAPERLEAQPHSPTTAAYARDRVRRIDACIVVVVHLCNPLNDSEQVAGQTQRQAKAGVVVMAKLVCPEYHRRCRDRRGGYLAGHSPRGGCNRGPADTTGVDGCGAGPAAGPGHQPRLRRLVRSGLCAHRSRPNRPLPAQPPTPRPCRAHQQLHEGTSMAAMRSPHTAIAATT